MKFERLFLQRQNQLPSLSENNISDLFALKF